MDDDNRELVRRPLAEATVSIETAHNVAVTSQSARWLPTIWSAWHIDSQ